MADPFRPNAFGKTVTEKYPIPNHSVIQTSTAQRPPGDRARMGTTIYCVRAHGAPAPTDVHATTQMRRDSKDARSASTRSLRNRVTPAVGANRPERTLICDHTISDTTTVTPRFAPETHRRLQSAT